MRAVEEGKKIERNNIINGRGKVSINKSDTNGHNAFCEDSYLNSKYYMKKTYSDGHIVNTRNDSHTEGIGHGKLVSVEFIGKK